MIQSKNSQTKITLLTERGFEKLNNELAVLRNEKRQEIVQKLREVADDNDLAEDDVFLLIKDEQAILEGRIIELERLLNRVEIITPGCDRGKVRLGSTVTIQGNSMSSETYTIVGTVEANSRNWMISDESPLGRSLLEHKVGDVVEVNAPGGIMKFRILSIT